MKDLETIVISFAEEAKKARVTIVTGDTKVVNKGKCDKLFINTAGIGSVKKKNLLISTGDNYQSRGSHHYQWHYRRSWHGGDECTRNLSTSNTP